ncbi:uracil-DNA glycosylase [Methylobacterium sp. W2]|uniref:uracil-DNA glycosylase n=1 Tax=Methylobacterium sp. W2 TaxID=2598107 RepID=UPI001D0CB6C6|nr:uracil-DNA glycosylase [Methylobacterium sp. W2]MCC0805293.1 uracil-DNA glycosylase [Methylobacterium sp. W2]
MSQGPDHQRDVIAELDFHVEAGVDLCLDEQPHDRFSETGEASPWRPAPTRRGSQSPESLPRVEQPGDAPQTDPAPLRRELPPRGQAPAAPPARTYGQSASAKPGEAAGDARARARDVATLEELEALLANFDGCPLKFTAKNLVFADGNPASKLMFIGEAPGADEDRVGKPFMGRSGQLLDRMMAAIGLDRTKAYVTNIVPWRPPGNRNPTPQEVSICKPFIERQIELANPHVIVCLGSPATQAITGTKDGILKARGRFYPYRVGDREVKALATLHPAYLLRQPLQKRLAWRDFRLLKATLDGKA